MQTTQNANGTASPAASLRAGLRDGAILAGEVVGVSAVLRGARKGPVAGNESAWAARGTVVISVTASAAAALFSVSLSEMAVSGAGKHPAAAAGCAFMALGFAWFSRVAADAPLEALGRQTLGRFCAVREYVGRTANPVLAGLRSSLRYCL